MILNEQLQTLLGDASQVSEAATVGLEAPTAVYAELGRCQAEVSHLSDDVMR